MAAKFHSFFRISENKFFIQTGKKYYWHGPEVYEPCSGSGSPEVVAMLGLNLLGKIDQRLRQAKNRDQPFGGCSVVLIGDYAQLPPVLATPLFGKAKQNDPFAVQGEFIYKMFYKVICLTEIKRQVAAAGDIDQAMFIVALNNIREGKSTFDDWKFLQKRAIGNILDFEDSEPIFKIRQKQAACLFPVNEKVNMHNVSYYSLTGIASYTGCKMFPAEDFRNLERLLYLAVDAEICLTTFNLELDF